MPSAGGVTTIESYLYSFTGPDLSSVLLRRSSDGGGSWSNVRQATYSYYGSGDDNGSPGDLKTAIVQTWSGSAWHTIETYYYRYWTSGARGIGMPHCVKYVVNPRAYAAMTAAGLDPTTATDAQVAGYADIYVEYDGQRRVTKEVVVGGQYTYTFAYTTNTSPDYFDDYNNWKMKTVETRPDGSTNTVSPTMPAT